MLGGDSTSTLLTRPAPISLKSARIAEMSGTTWRERREGRERKRERVREEREGGSKKGEGVRSKELCVTLTFLPDELVVS